MIRLVTQLQLAYGPESLARVGLTFLRGRPNVGVLSTAHLSTKTTDSPYDIGIVGGGIVGLATARELLVRYPHLKVILVEKESELSRHQSGHNSGVIHAGIYYEPGSLKARLCVEGLKRTYAYCDEKKLPYKKVGKLIVAVTPEELPRLDNLWKRGEANGVPDMRMLTGEKEIVEIEPNCRGLKAIHSPHTGIIDYRVVSLSFADDIRQSGGAIRTRFEVSNFVSRVASISLESTDGSQVDCRHVITCGGLHSDRLAEKSGCSPVPKIVPFRGDYLLLKPEASNLVRGNIYPVPDPRFPFLGVHFTPRMDGSVWLGPNAVLSLKREGYGLTDFSPRDAWDAVAFSGLRKIAWRFLGVGLSEMAGVMMPSRTIAQLQRYIPTLRPQDVIRGPSGVRAQALDAEGHLVDDFIIDRGEGEAGRRIMHVRNAPSPAATSSMAIARLIADKAETQFGDMGVTK